MSHVATYWAGVRLPFLCTLGGPFDELFLTRLPATRALCEGIFAVISASTVCYSDVVGIIAPKSPFVKPSKENLFKPLSGQRRFGLTDFSALRERSAQTFGTAGLAFQKNGLFSLHRAEKQKTESFLKKTEKIFKKRVTFLQKNRL